MAGYGQFLERRLITVKGVVAVSAPPHVDSIRSQTPLLSPISQCLSFALFLFFVFLLLHVALV